MSKVIYIEKKSVAPIEEAVGAVSDTLNVVDKVKNAPSINLVQNMTGIPQDGVIYYDGEVVPEGYEEVEEDDGYVMGKEYIAYCAMSNQQYYNTWRGFVPLKNAQKYNITITGFRVEKENKEIDLMSNIDLSSTDQKYEIGFVVSNKSSNAAGGWCRIKFTLSKL